MKADLIDFLYNNREIELYNINGIYIGYLCGYSIDLDYAILVCKSTQKYWSKSFLGSNDFIFKELDESKIEQLLYFDIRNVYTDRQKTITLYNLYQEHETLKN